jgi:hypothetical protein
VIRPIEDTDRDTVTLPNYMLIAYVSALLIRIPQVGDWEANPTVGITTPYLSMGLSIISFYAQLN